MNAGSGEISVELRLALNKLKGDLQNAVKQIRAGLTQDLGNIGKQTAKSAAEEENLSRKVKKTNDSYKERLRIMREEWRGRNPNGVIAGQTISFTASNSRRNLSANPFQDEANAFGRASTAMSDQSVRDLAAALRGNLANQISSRSLQTPPPGEKISPHAGMWNRIKGGFSQLHNLQGNPFDKFFGTVQAMRNITLPIGQLLASFYVIGRAVGFVLKPLTALVHLMFQQADAAQKIYVNSVKNGMSVGQSVRMNTFSQVLGVGQNDLMQFSQQIVYLSKNLEYANQVFTNSNRPLTTLSLESKSLGINFRALIADLASGMEPVLLSFVANLNQFIIVLGKSKVLNVFIVALDIIFQAINDIIGAAFVFQNMFDAGLKESFDTVMIGVGELYNKIIKFFPSGTMNKIDVDAYRKDRDEMQAYFKKEALTWSQNLFGNYSQAPTAQAGMRQIAASNWEKMGLVIGGGIGINHAAETAKNTKKSADTLQKIAGYLANPRTSGMINPVFNGA